MTETFDITVENQDYVEGKWTTFEGKLPEGVYMLRCKNIKGEWFNSKARFDKSKGWNAQTAEEWVRKFRPYQTAVMDTSKQVSLQQLLKSAPRLSLEEIQAIENEKRKRELEILQPKRRTVKQIFSKFIPRRIDDGVKRIDPADVKLNHIYVGDSVEIMKFLPSNYYDAVVTDPPYNLGKKYKSGIDDALRDQDYYNWSFKWIDEAVRVLKPHGQLLIAIWATFKYDIKVYIERNHKNKLRFLEEINWKTTGVPRAASGKLREDVTPWLHFGPKLNKGEPTINYTWNVDDVRSWKFVKHKDKAILKRNRRYIHPLGKDPSTLWEFYKEKNPNEFRTIGSNFYVLNWFRKFLEILADYSIEHAIQLYDMPSNIIEQRNLPSTHRDRLDHPCQMPVEVPMQLIKLTTDPGSRILDPFMGTGTTGHAATVLGRHCTGIELSPDYAIMAKDRLNRAYIKKQAAVEYWDGRPPSWTVDECTPQFDDPRHKSLLEFFAIGTAGGKRLGDDLVEDIAQELSRSDFLSVLTNG